MDSDATQPVVVLDDEHSDAVAHGSFTIVSESRILTVPYQLRMGWFHDFRIFLVFGFLLFRIN